MARLHLVELEDLSWFPRVLRDGGTAFLSFAARVSGQDVAFAPLIERVLTASGERALVDLCSGGGAPATTVAAELSRRGLPVHLVLTDFFPNLSAMRQAVQQSSGVDACWTPVDARAVPAHLPGMRTLFNAFHHFRPNEARAILEDAVRNRRPIGIFEIVRREWPLLLAVVLTPLITTLSMPLWRPFRPAWIVWTWILPVMQAFILWDGLVSWLRVYSESELRALVESIDAEDWTWEIGSVSLGLGPARGTWLVGYPSPAATRSDALRAAEQ